MINIITDRNKVIRSLQELEFEYAQGNISEKVYISQKKELELELENFAVADRVKRLQGKKEAEKPLEYWTEKKEAEEAKKAKEELMKKFITKSSPTYPTDTTKKGINKSKAVLTSILVLIFFIGIGFGVFLMKVPEQSTAVPMTINQSAFPVLNNTNATNITDTSTESTKYTQNTSYNTGGDTGGGTGGETGGGTGDGTEVG